MARAAHLLVAGRIPEAHALLARENLAAIPVNNLWLIDMAFLAVVAARSGDEDRAGAIDASMHPCADQIAGIAPLWLGSVAHYLGLLATTLRHFHDAAAHFRDAEGSTGASAPPPGWPGPGWSGLACSSVVPRRVTPSGLGVTRPGFSRWPENSDW